MKKLLDIGIITGAHGVKGEIKVLPISADASNFHSLNKVFIKDIAYIVTSVRFVKNQALLKLDTINDRTTADTCKGNYVSITREQAVPLEKDTYYMEDIIGCDVFEKNEFTGVITDIIETGSNDVYDIDGSDGKYRRQILLPAIKSVVLNIDIVNKRIDVLIPKGLLDDEYI